MSKAIYPKDIMPIIRKSKSTASRLLQLIKDTLGKAKHQPVTLQEFADYMGFNAKDIEQNMKL